MNKKFVLLPLAILLTACDSVGEQVAQGQLSEVTGCDVADSACTADFGEGHVLTLRLGPPVRPLTPFMVQADITGMEARGVTVDFKMVGMDMGSNRYRLTPKEGVWHGQTILPICTASRSDWTADVEVETPEGIVKARFGFVSEGK